MARYDVYLLSPASENFSYVLDVQTDVLNRIGSRVVVPLVAFKSFSGEYIERLMPQFIIGDQKLFMATPSIAAVPETMLNEHIISLQEHDFEITAALDFLFHGF